MVKYHVMYPYKAGTRFDIDYYRDQHMAKARAALLPVGLVGTTIDKGLNGGGRDKPPAYHCIAIMLFNNREEMKSAFAKADPKVMQELLDDIPNYTDVQPVMMVTESAD